MLVVQNASEPAAIRNSVVDLISGGVIDLKVAAAYVTYDGAWLLLSSLKNGVGEESFEKLPKVLVTSFDYGITDPAALASWQKLKNSTVLVAGSTRIAAGSLMPSRAFHPKIYAFGKSASEYSLLVGSANLTTRGFSVNTEAAWAEQEVKSTLIQEAFSRAQFDTVPLTDELLAAYQELRKKKPPPPEIKEEGEPVPTPAPVASGSLEALRTAIDNGDVYPDAFGAMWIQGEALQGGSRNQLELPRGAHKFFKFIFDKYDYPDKITIGQPVLQSGPRIWNDRILSWHGNNKMERMNLPTLAQGGFSYVDTAVMFRRLKDEKFELIVTPWESDLAKSWRQASAQKYTLFRLGTVATSRLVGLI